MAKSSGQIKRQPNSPPTFDKDSLTIFANVFDLFGTLDETGKVIDLGGRIFERTNANPELLTGQRFAETVFWQSSENTAKIIEKSIESAAAGEHCRLLLDFRVSADEKIPVELIFQPLGQTIFVCAQAMAGRGDKIRSFKHESEQLLFAAENAEIGLWYWDYAVARIYSTPRCNELFGLPAYEALSYEGFLSVVHPEDREFVEHFITQSRENGSKYEEEFRVVYADGSIEWLCSEGKSFLDESGSPQRMMGVVRKITEQKLAADELAMVNEREKKARDEAIEANRAKDFFLAFVSHELRSPLNAILGWSKILLTREVSEETRRSALETIEKSARVQTKLINDLVDSARVASGKLRLEYRLANLFEIVKSSFEAQRPAAEYQNLKYSLTSDQEQTGIFGDAGRLQQVFVNLISNAVKFTPAGGEVNVDIKTNDEFAAVTVSDNGQGIDPKALPNIFRQFSQGEAEQVRRSGGLGLGLSIVNLLVGKHGGSVEAESSGLGLGSRFTVKLPLSDSALKQLPIEAPKVEKGQKRLQNVSILIVEDDADSREVLQLFLEQNGAAVRSVDSARAAMQALAEASGVLPDILISDLAMPDEDGYSLIARIRNMPKEGGGAIPALALSAFASAESRQKAFDAGFQRYSTKPFEPDSIVDEILALRKG